MSLKRAVLALAVAATSLVAGAETASADPVTLYDQSGPGTCCLLSSETFPSFPLFDSEGADDFVVPSDQTWSISSVETLALDGIPDPGHPTFRVRFYADAAGAPGPLQADRTASAAIVATIGSDVRQALTLSSTVVLGPGTHWVSVQALDSAPGSQWYWRSVDVRGSAGHWRNPGGGYSYPCATFLPVGTCTGGADVDWAFAIVGELVTPVQFQSADFHVEERYAPNGRATITVVRSGDTGGFTTVKYATSNGSALAAKDYVATSGTLTFGPGETTKTFSVRILRDTSTEGSETLLLTLSDVSAGSSIGATNPATLYIED